MCDPLCSSDPEIQYAKCLNHFMFDKRGKSVILGKWKSTNIVLKSTRMKVFNVNVNETVDEEFLTDIHRLLQTVKQLIHKEHNIMVNLSDQQLIGHLWPSLDDKTIAMLYEDDNHQTTYSMKQAKRAILRSLWALAEQREYLFLQYFSNIKFFPKILGFCGHVYAMEHLPQYVGAPMYDFELTINPRTWQENVKIALNLLEMVKFLDENYHEPIYMCDVKSEHFGVTSTGQVKMIDTDMIYTLSSLQHRSCISKCDISYCKRSCNVATGKCIKALNNNLQVSADIF